ncbi:hypothetical protein [Mesorhizobium sp.]|uniref:hypothetical protein n=1 Tax=Mesorhizobium sp. TaxID=1871066 RepID=UPI000FE770DF|nr:hypothetical protein [Mesorhizobium sp.]RWP46877.1 MAG: hypothetical protein EOR05_19850 [Mesorhizobium sp.]
MDIEKERRADLIAGLGEQFRCFEEVTLTHATFTRRKIRADVIAIPVDDRLADYALAFEVKEPSQAWNYSDWSHAIRQASDYVYGKIDPVAPAAKYAGRRIACAFMFPSPPYNPHGLPMAPTPFVRPGLEQMVSGQFHLALHFRVGRAFWETSKLGRRFALSFGPNPLWDSEHGFLDRGLSLIAGKRTLGSGKIDVKAELDGWGRRKRRLQNRRPGQADAPLGDDQ